MGLTTPRIRIWKIWEEWPRRGAEYRLGKLESNRRNGPRRFPALRFSWEECLQVRDREHEALLEVLRGVTQNPFGGGAGEPTPAALRKLKARQTQP